MSYPRPQLKRKEWTNLSGEWKMNGEKCIVPSCIQAEKMDYKKTFHYEKKAERVLLHFGAVDQIAKVFLNGTLIGVHEGGYLPFTFEVTEWIQEENLLEVEVEDFLDHTYPYGKQRKDRGGMWYTPVSGIWQTVWLEDVPKEYIKEVHIQPDLTGIDLEKVVETSAGENVISERIEIENPILWTPENPYLYTQTVTFQDDEVEIYFALRTIDIRELNGIQRVCLNGRPVFLHGILDQGYFGTDLFLPKDTEEFSRDVLRMKSLGFNCLRKHIKVEPEDYYYACDKLGMLVLQDMVNSGDYHFFKDTLLGTLGIPFCDRKKTLTKRENFFFFHCAETVNHLRNHPCVVAYTIFNEGWGQFNSDELYEQLKQLDASRLFDATSGWFHQKNSDFDSMHVYFRLKKLKPKYRPLFVSECGGYSYNLQGQKKVYGYGACHSKEELTARIELLYEKMILPAIPAGCCGCIYTQVSDIEDEINGLYSENRSICKVQEEKMRHIAARLQDALSIERGGL